MTTQIQLGAIDSTAVSSLQGPRITSVAVTDNTYTAIDDTAVDSTSGGYIKITGTGFVSGCIVTVGNITATSTTFISSTEVRAQLGAQAAGSYNLYVSNPDGSLSIKVLGINYSGMPSWITAANQTFAAATVSFQFAANSDSAIAYSVNTGSTLPGGLSLSNNGLLSGNVSGSSGTVYTFTLQATDIENQNTPRTFIVTLSFSEPYFNHTTLLIHADGINAANNNTFIDSSTNAFTITKAGTPIQGTSSPFSPSGWSNYFTSGNVLTSTLSGTGLSPNTNKTWTMEFWINPSSYPASAYYTIASKGTSGNRDWCVFINTSGQISYYYSPSSGDNFITASTALTKYAWQHVAIVSNNAAITIYLNGVSVGTGTQASFNTSNPTYFNFGSFMDYGATFYPNDAYVSNFRYVQGTMVYTGAFTPPTSPLTAISGTTLLACQSNRFKDNSTNAFTLTATGTPSVQSFSPFGGSSSYSTSTAGGSYYFNGSTDYLSIASGNLLNLSSASNWTLEAWIYPTATLTNYMHIFFGSGISLGSYSGTLFVTNNSAQLINGGTLSLNTWHHIALVNVANSSYNLYLNGVRTATGSAASFTSTTTYIGGNSSGGQLWPGYISQARITNTAVYTGTSYTVPTAPLTAITGTQLLLNGTNSAIFDQTGKNNLLTGGSAQISTAQYKFGTGSMYFNGTTDYMTTAGINQLLLFGSAAFTIEHWVKFTSTTSYINSIGDNSYFTTSNNFLFMWNYAGAGRLSFWINNAAVCSTANAYNDNAWHHVAVTRTAAGVVTIWVDGVADGTASGYGSTNIGTGSIIIGNQAQVSRYWAGYIDEVRITRGYARYTSTFTPSTSAFNDQ